ncbi:MAG: ATP-binding protein [Rhodospirillaceae bacterium]
MTDTRGLSSLGRLALVFCAVLTGWTALVWLAGDRLSAQRIEALVKAEGALMDEHADALSYNLHRSLAFQHALPTHFASDDDVVSAAQRYGHGGHWSGRDFGDRQSALSATPDLVALSRHLAREAGQFGIDIAWVLAINGDCIATSNFDRPESFLGTNYSDRDYYTMARDGRAGHQFAVGRRTGIPGLYFSAPVLVGSENLGVVVIKIDLVKLSPLLGSADSFVTDEYGVVIMARRPALYLRVLPDNRLAELTPAARELRYRQRDFRPLEIASWPGLDHDRIYRFEGEADPYLMTTRAESAEGMTVHVIDPLNDIGEIAHSVRILKIAVVIAGTTLMLLAAGAILYLRRSARHVQELREKSVALEAARQRAEAAGEAKAQFLANMSHEIRTPMNAVLGFSEVLSWTPLTEAQRTYVDKTLVAGRALMGILNDILDYSKIEAGRLELEDAAFSLPELLTDVATIVSVNARQKNLAVSIDAAPEGTGNLMGDSLRLQQILLNLIGNAIKFTESGTVTLAIAVTDRQPDRVVLRFEIQDTGIGIARETVPSLFSPFTQADSSTSRRFGGSGLGLAICRRLVNLMGGEIGVDSTEGQGSVFWFTAPFAPVAEAGPTA